MKINLNQQILLFFRYMRLFGISFFSVSGKGDGSLKAKVAWEEDCQNGLPDADDIQEVVWKFDGNKAIEDALTLGEYAYDAGLIASDRILIDDIMIQKQFEWDADRCFNAIQKLTNIRVLMLDEGKESDSFMLHR